MSTLTCKKSLFDFLKTLTILCVEDQASIRIVYEVIFEELSTNIIFAHDGKDGLKKFEENEVDIIITDQQMPNLDGLDMISLIREKDEQTPIILVTAFNDINVLSKALNLNINGFVQKPLDRDEILSAIEKVTKIVIANNYLKDKDEYQIYQENLGFAKELNILRNDYYYQMIDSDGISLLDFLYNPLDIMSGDAYSARRIDEHSTFYLMVDGMGKGVSASLTAMNMTSFVNYYFDKVLENGFFDFHKLVEESLDFIRPILLEEEALALDFVVINNERNMICYAKFAMPVLLMQTRDNEVIRLKSNNPPLSKYLPTFKIDECDISNITKFLIYSDGIVENDTICDGKPYADFIEDDFLNSFTREELKDRFFEKISEQDDDVTLIFIKKIHETKIDIATKVFDTKLEVVEEEAANWYSDLWKNFDCNDESSYKADLVFTELLMNAYEHGNLGIDKREKHLLLNEDRYFEVLLEKEQECDKKIEVSVSKIEYKDSTYIITKISDEGNGFDTQSLSEIFRNSQIFNGRGVFVSRKNSLGIYYNQKGNVVLYLNKI
jgi:CheY-like chemotaxis protein